jgi:hypothetical protein
MFKIFAPQSNLGLSFLFNSDKSLKCEIPLAFAATKKIIKNSSMAPLFSLGGPLIGLDFFVGVIVLYANS